MLCMDEISILMIYMKEVLEHTKYKMWDGKNLAKGTGTELFRNSDK